MWLRLCAPSSPADFAELAEAALDTGAPLDITGSPGLWGGYLRGVDRVLSYVSASGFERATDSKHAADLVDADLIATLSCLGRDCVDFYFLPIRGPFKESRLDGALEALEAARQEGHIRYPGIACMSTAADTMAAWRFRDAFDVLLTPDKEVAELTPLARERRVGLIGLDTTEDVDASLISVRSAEGIGSLLLSGIAR